MHRGSICFRVVVIAKAMKEPVQDVQHQFALNWMTKAFALPVRLIKTHKQINIQWDAIDRSALRKIKGDDIGDRSIAQMVCVGLRHAGIVQQSNTHFALRGTRRTGRQAGLRLNDVQHIAG